MRVSFGLRALLVYAATLLGTWAAPTAGATETESPVRYTLSVPEPQTQLATITLRVDASEAGPLDVHMPTWRPGRYVMLDPAGTVRRFAARDGDGNTIPWRKTRGSTWTLDVPAPGPVEIEYELFANNISDRTRHVDDTHGFFSGSGVFMYTDAHRGRPCEITLDIPAHWDVASGLDPVEGDPRTLRAADYDILVDSPIECGLFERFSFDVRGVPHEVTLWGDAPVGGEVTIERIARDFGAIVESQADMFGEIPYERYVFIVHAGEGLGGGTEHWNSTVMQARPERFLEQDEYERFLGLASHEIFHVWNVKRLRPAGLVPYDYQDENLTSLLWVAEGTTSYYDDLTLARTGLISIEGYLERLERSIAGYRANPGRMVQPLSHSSTDSWTRFNTGGSDRDNSTVSFYRKGSLVSLLLDMRIRAQTDGASSLDDLMRDIYERYPLESGGFTPQDFAAAVDRVGGGPAATFFEDYVDGLAELPLEEALRRCGIELVRDDEHEPEPWIGLRLNGAEVRSARADGPAYAAGLINGDEIVAIDGKRFVAGGMDDVLARHEPGETVEVTFFRRGVLRSLQVEVSTNPAAGWTLRKIEEPTAEQVSAFESWLMQPWDEPAEDGSEEEETSPAAQAPAGQAEGG